MDRSVGPVKMRIPRSSLRSVSKIKIRWLRTFSKSTSQWPRENHWQVSCHFIACNFKVFRQPSGLNSFPNFPKFLKPEIINFTFYNWYMGESGAVSSICKQLVVNLFILRFCLVFHGINQKQLRTCRNQSRFFMLIEKFRLQMVLQESIKTSLSLSASSSHILDNFKSMKNIHIHIHVRLVHRHPDNQGLVVHMTKVTVPQPNGLVVMEVVPVLDLVQVNHKELKIKHFCLANLKFSWSQIRIHKLWIISKDS